MKIYKKFLHFFDHRGSVRRRKPHNALLGSSFFVWFRGHSPPTSQALTLSSCFSICVCISFKILSLSVVVIGRLSGHTAVNVGKSKVVVFGGLFDKRFLSDIMVYDVGTPPFLMSMGGFLFIFSARFLIITSFLISFLIF